VSARARQPEAKLRYREISDWLIAKCAELPPGSSLPSESELAEMFGVSRMTARHGLEILRLSGRIERRQGVGSFVASPALHREESVLYSFSEEMRKLGYVPGSVVVSQGLVIEPSQAIVMGLDPKQPLIKIDRVRHANGDPIAREIAYLPSRFRQLLQQDLSTGSLHTSLKELGVTLARAAGFVTARLATPRECELLDQSPPAALLIESRRVMDEQGEIVESTETAYLGSQWAIDTSAIVKGELTKVWQ
jgi:GntR family transcriptional regulator